MTDKKKFHKRLSKKCPECGATLVVMEYQKEKDGVLYSENIIECTDSDCEYFEILRTKGMKKLLFDD
jgi:hypothetical protein